MTETLRAVWAAYSVGHPSIRQVASDLEYCPTYVNRMRRILCECGYLAYTPGHRTTVARIPLIIERVQP